MKTYMVALLLLGTLSAQASTRLAVEKTIHCEFSEKGTIVPLKDEGLLSNLYTGKAVSTDKRIAASVIIFNTDTETRVLLRLTDTADPAGMNTSIVSFGLPITSKVATSVYSGLDRYDIVCQPQNP